MFNFCILYEIVFRRPRKLAANRSPFHGFPSSSSENSFTVKNEQSSEKNHGYSSPEHTAEAASEATSEATSEAPSEAPSEAAENPKTRNRLKIRNKRSKEPPLSKNLAQQYGIRPCSVVLRRVIQLYVPRGVFQLSN